MLGVDLTLTDERTLYVGTDHALYRACPGSDGRWRAEGLALAGLGGVRGFLIDPDDPRRWIACTSDCGILVSADDGATWRESNRGITRLQGWCLARHPATGELWYGAGPASVYRSADAGRTWSACAGIDALPERGQWDSPHPSHTSHVRHLAFGSGGLVLAAVEEGWLLRSDDGGQTWSNARDGIERDCHAACVLPDQPDVVIAATGYGIFRSQDGGRSFVRSADGLHHRYVCELTVHPRRPEVVFTAASQTDPASAAQQRQLARGAFYRSDDGGLTWRRLTGGLLDVVQPVATCVAGDPGDPDSFYVGTIDGGVWLSEDGGGSFDIAVEGIQGWVRHLLVHRR